MVPAGSSSSSIPERPEVPWAGHDADCTVVWLSGEHDVSTDVGLCMTLACRIALDRDVVVDLSNVDFMGVSTLRVISQAKESCRLRGRRLTVRFPSSFLRRVTRVDGLADLFDIGPNEPGTGRFEALASWVEVMRADRADREPDVVIEPVADDARMGGDSNYGANRQVVGADMGAEVMWQR